MKWQQGIPQRFREFEERIIREGRERGVERRNEALEEERWDVQEVVVKEPERRGREVEKGGEMGQEAERNRSKSRARVMAEEVKGVLREVGRVLEVAVGGGSAGRQAEPKRAHEARKEEYHKPTTGERSESHYEREIRLALEAHNAGKSRVRTSPCLLEAVLSWLRLPYPLSPSFFSQYSHILIFSI